MSIIKNIDLVVFDLDGTFYPQKKVKKSLIKKFVFQLRKLKRYQSSRHQLVGSNYHSFEELISETSTLMKEKNNHWILKRFYPKFIESFSKIDAHPLVNSSLKKIKDKGIKISVVSDYHLVEERLDLLGVDKNLIDFTFGAESKGLLKPNTKITEILEDEFKILRTKFCFVGDRVDTDQEIAKQSQSSFIGITFEENSNPDFISWEELFEKI